MPALNTGCMLTQSCLTLCHPLDCSLPGSSVHGILQARILEWVAISSSRRSSRPRDRTQVSFSRGSSRPGIEPWSPTLQADSLPPEPSGNTPNTGGQPHRSCHRHPCFWPPVGPTFHPPGPSQVLPAARGTRASSVKANQTARPSSLRPRSSLLNASALVRGPPTPEAKRCAGTQPRPDRVDTESARAALLCFSQDQSHTGVAPDTGSHPSRRAVPQNQTPGVPFIRMLLKNFVPAHPLL